MGSGLIQDAYGPAGEIISPPPPPGGSIVPPAPVAPKQQGRDRDAPLVEAGPEPDAAALARAEGGATGGSAGTFFLPVAGGSVTPHGEFGASRSAYAGEFGQVGAHTHAGRDYATAPGSPIVAAGDGIVVQSQPHQGYGNTIDIQLADGRMVRYAHVESPTVHVGMQVKGNQQIATAGDVGHVHVELHSGYDQKNPANNYGMRTAIDPQSLFGGASPASGDQPTMADYWNHKAEGAIGAEMGIARSTAAGMSAKMQEYARIANAAAPGSKEADEALASLRKEAAIDRAAYREKMMKPPVEKPVDAWANFGSVATIMGLLGGLFTRQHITGALNAAGAAMEAINTNNHQIFEQSYKTWHDQTEMAHTLFQMDQEDIKDILTDKRMGIDEKTTRLLALSTELGMMKATGDVLASPFEHMVTLYDRRAAAATSVANTKLQTEEATKNYFFQANLAKGMPAPEAMAEAIRQSKGLVIPGAAAKPDDIVATDKDGKEIYKGKATFDPQKKTYTPVGRSEALPPDVTVTHAPPSSGNRVQPQLQRLLGAGSQMEAHLTNLSEMPIGGSIGAFMGVENRAPDELSEGLKRTAMRKLFSSDEIKAMQNEFIGVGRQIAALDAQGAATGLVGLSKQAEGYAPLPDDSPVIVMRKYASLRQIVEQAMKGVLLSGTANPDQKAGAKEIIGKAQAAIPYTVHDVNQIQFGGEKGSTDAAVEIINRRRRELAFDELLKHKDDPAYRESFEKHFGKEALDRALGNGQ